MTRYTDLPDEDDDVMTVEEFRAAVAQGFFIDYDGFGYPMRDGRMDPEVPVYPSAVHLIPKDATHVAWFNR